MAKRFWVAKAKGCCVRACPPIQFGLPGIVAGNSYCDKSRTGNGSFISRSQKRARPTLSSSSDMLGPGGKVMRCLPIMILVPATSNICKCRSSKTRHVPSERFDQAEDGSVARFLMASSASGSKDESYGIMRKSASLARNISFSGHMISKYLSPVITLGSMRGLLLTVVWEHQFNAGMTSRQFVS